MIATELAHSGTSMRLAISLPPARPIPTPNSAVASGRPIATSDPKATSRISAATARPGPSAPMLLDCTFSMACPDSSISTPGRAGLGGEVDHVGGDVDGEAGTGRVELDDGVRRGAVGRHLAPLRRRPTARRRRPRGAAPAAGRPAGSATVRTASELDPAVVVDDDGDGVAGPVREALVEQLDGGLGVRAGREELLLALASEHGPEATFTDTRTASQRPRRPTGAGTTTK